MANKKVNNLKTIEKTHTFFNFQTIYFVTTKQPFKADAWQITSNIHTQNTEPD